MKVRDAIQSDVDAKRLDGAVYANGTQSLSSFCLRNGNIELGTITERKVASFLDGPHTSAVRGIKLAMLETASFGRLLGTQLTLPASTEVQPISGR